MSYADELDDAEAGRTDMTALLTPDPAGWHPLEWHPQARKCPAHGWYMPHADTGYRCRPCFALALADRIARTDAHHDHHTAHPEGPT